jgi:hypothetical protein
MLLITSLAPIYRVKERIFCAKTRLLRFRVVLKIYAREGTVPGEIAICVDRTLSLTGRLINLVIGFLNARSFCLLIVVGQCIVREKATVKEINIEVV